MNHIHFLASSLLTRNILVFISPFTADMLLEFKSYSIFHALLTQTARFFPKHTKKNETRVSYLCHFR